MATLPGECSFNGVTFDIEASDAEGWTQYPQLGDDGVHTLVLTILFDTHVDWLAFLALQSRVTVKTALGTNAGRVYVHAGPGAKTLSIPTGTNGANANWSAVLTSVTAIRHGWDSGLYRAEAMWVLLP